MVILTLDIPDELARTLEILAGAENKTVSELALDQLCSLAEFKPSETQGSPAAVRNALLGLPRVSVAEVEALEAAMATGRLPVSAGDVFGA